MELNEFVEKSFGEHAVSLLKSMRRGGDSNEKGAAFERNFTAHKVIEAWSNRKSPPKEVIFVLQGLAFVDDLAISDLSVKSKINYQAKNSETQAAAYTDEIHSRFTMQAQIDRDYFGIENSKQVLLVSCNKRCMANNRVIVAKSKETAQIGIFTSEFFPYASNQMDLFNLAQDLRANICAIINKNDLSSIDNAFRLVIGAMNGKSKFSLQEVIEKAKELSKPDLFIDFELDAVEPPEWLIGVVSAFDNVNFVVKSRNFYINVNGMEVRLPADLAEPSAEQVARIKTKGDLVALLMALATKEFKVEQEEV